MGRLTKDPELRYTPNGVETCSFSIAVDRNYVRQGGDRQTDFLSIVAWRRQAEFICKYFSKGRMIAIVGNLQSRSWDGQDGVRRYATEVIVDEVYFADSKRDSGSGSFSQLPQQPPASPVSGYGAQEASSYSTPASAPGDNFLPVDIDDDLPF
jgi:single-strand DNA-binding protein